MDGLGKAASTEMVAMGEIMCMMRKCGQRICKGGSEGSINFEAITASCNLNLFRSTPDSKTSELAKASILTNLGRQQSSRIHLAVCFHRLIAFLFSAGEWWQTRSRSVKSRVQLCSPSRSGLTLGDEEGNELNEAVMLDSSYHDSGEHMSMSGRSGAQNLLQMMAIARSARSRQRLWKTLRVMARRKQSSGTERSSATMFACAVGDKPIRETSTKTSRASQQRLSSRSLVLVRLFSWRRTELSWRRATISRLPLSLHSANATTEHIVVASNSSTIDSWNPQAASRFTSSTASSHVPKARANHMPVLHCKEVEFYLKQFYLRHNPSKVREAPEIAKMYHQSLDKLEQDLLRKYGTNLGIASTHSDRGGAHPVGRLEHVATPRPHSSRACQAAAAAAAAAAASRSSLPVDVASTLAQTSKRTRQDSSPSQQAAVRVMVSYQIQRSMKQAPVSPVSSYPLYDMKQSTPRGVRCSALEAPAVYMRAAWIF
eukprot:755775-Hanusia_phi.AAC.1